MSKNPTPTFSLRSFMAFCLGIGLLCGLVSYFLALVVFSITVLYFVLLLAGSAFASCFPTGQTPLLRRRFASANRVNDGPFVLTVCFLTLFFCSWRVLFLFYLPLPFSGFWQEGWHIPLSCGVTLATIEHASFIVFQLYLYASYFGECYGSGIVSRWSCGMTACLSVFLLVCHFGIP